MSEDVFEVPPLELPEITIERGGIEFPKPGFLGRPVPMIYTLLARVMAEVSHVGKTGFNETHKYNFRGIDAVVNALGPAMRKHGVVPVPKLRKATYRDTMTTGKEPRPTREVSVEVRYRFFAPDGSYVDATVPGESLDQSDKGSAKAMSVAYRIALLQVFALPTDEPDPDASYHTRDGAGSMSKSVATLLQSRIGAYDPSAPGPGVELADAAELERLWPIVLEHSAAERMVPGTETTWAAAFIQRFTVLIEEIESWDVGKAMLGVIDRLGLQRALGSQLRERAAYLKERATKSFDHAMQHITAAADLYELEIAVGCVHAGLESLLLTDEQGQQLLAVAAERRPRLPELKTDASAAEVAEPREFLPTEGDLWELFCAAADHADLGADDLRSLLDGKGEVPEAEVFGAPGFQRVLDALARSHRRDHTIDAEARTLLLSYLIERVEAAGLDPEPYEVRSW